MAMWSACRGATGNDTAAVMTFAPCRTGQSGPQYLLDPNPPDPGGNRWRAAEPPHQTGQAMIKSLSQHTCAFDCEWVPCPTTARRLLALPPDTDDRAAMEAVWACYRGADDAPESRPFLKLVLSQVVSIAVVMRDVDTDGTVHLKLGARSVAMCPEGELIQRFLEKVAADHYQLWGYNSSTADLPILVQRAIALGVPCPTFSKRPKKPWEGYDYHDGRNSDAHLVITIYTKHIRTLSALCNRPPADWMCTFRRLGRTAASLPV